ncbi:regenerating islet-derived protein 3-gamma-like [Nycticebus coucang]|uniref:regenerating islet-derived protein 3-gamma-like n=1 Tax=Nycticebus coucang TaxID=9470 RepID=UPI00234D2C47|nr:regenerating islet-derived protein 3-gamma-like [Nycticebus coucang]
MCLNHAKPSFSPLAYGKTILHVPGAKKVGDHCYNTEPALAPSFTPMSSHQPSYLLFFKTVLWVWLGVLPQKSPPRPWPSLIGGKELTLYLLDNPSLPLPCPPLGEVSGSLSFSSCPAQLACQKRPSGHLVSVLSASEGSFVSSLVRSTANSNSYVWIGLHDPTQGAEPNGDGWEWSSFDVLNYFAWERNPPSTPNPGYCGSVSRSTGFLKWKDYNCDIKLPYVCKFKD